MYGTHLYVHFVVWLFRLFYIRADTPASSVWRVQMSGNSVATQLRALTVLVMKMSAGTGCTAMVFHDCQKVISPAHTHSHPHSLTAESFHFFSHNCLSSISLSMQIQVENESLKYWIKNAINHQRFIMNSPIANQMIRCKSLESQYRLPSTFQNYFTFTLPPGSSVLLQTPYPSV